MAYAKNDVICIAQHLTLETLLQEWMSDNNMNTHTLYVILVYKGASFSARDMKA